MVKFSDRKKRDNVRKDSNKLKGSKIWITDQYPKSVVENRKYLIRLLKQARDADVKAVLIYDKLCIGDGGGSIQVAIENHNAKKQKKKSSVLSNNDNGVTNSQEYSVLILLVKMLCR